MAEIGAFKNILAIRFMRLGDVILLLPALAQLKSSFPNSRLALLTDERCAPIAKMCPMLDEVIGVNRLEMRDGSRISALGSMKRLVRDVRRRHFDLVIDFLSFRETNLLAKLSGAPYRLGMKRYDRAYLNFCFNLPPVLEDKGLHVAEMFQRIVDSLTTGRRSASTPVSLLQLPPEASRWVDTHGPQETFIALYVGAPVSDRRWPAEGFAKVARFAVEELGVPVVVIAGAPDAAVARRVRELCSEPLRVSVFDNLSLEQLAALISRARLLVSNDTGPMHLGPAFNVPTLGLFSVGFPEHYRPLGERSRFLRSNPIEALSPDDVIRNVKEMW